MFRASVAIVIAILAAATASNSVVPQVDRRQPGSLGQAICGPPGNIYIAETLTAAAFELRFRDRQPVVLSSATEAALHSHRPPEGSDTHHTRTAANASHENGRLQALALMFPSLPVAVGPVELEFVSAVHEEGVAVPLNRVVRDVNSDVAAAGAVNDEDKDDDELTTHVRNFVDSRTLRYHPELLAAFEYPRQPVPAALCALFRSRAAPLAAPPIEARGAGVAPTPEPVAAHEVGGGTPGVLLDRGGAFGCSCLPLALHVHAVGHGVGWTQSSGRLQAYHQLEGRSLWLLSEHSPAGGYVAGGHVAAMEASNATFSAAAQWASDAGLLQPQRPEAASAAVEAATPAAAHVQRRELHAGDILLVPAGWFFSYVAVGEAPSVGSSFARCDPEQEAAIAREEADADARRRRVKPWEWVRPAAPPRAAPRTAPLHSRAADANAAAAGFDDEERVLATGAADSGEMLTATLDASGTSSPLTPWGGRINNARAAAKLQQHQEVAAAQAQRLRAEHPGLFEPTLHRLQRYLARAPQLCNPHMLGLSSLPILDNDLLGAFQHASNMWPAEPAFLLATAREYLRRAAGLALDSVTDSSTSSGGAMSVTTSAGQPPPASFSVKEAAAPADVRPHAHSKSAKLVPQLAQADGNPHPNVLTHLHEDDPRLVAPRSTLDALEHALADGHPSHVFCPSLASHGPHFHPDLFYAAVPASRRRVSESAAERIAEFAGEAADRLETLLRINPQHAEALAWLAYAAELQAGPGGQRTDTESAYGGGRFADRALAAASAAHELLQGSDAAVCNLVADLLQAGARPGAVHYNRHTGVFTPVSQLPSSASRAVASRQRTQCAAAAQRLLSGRTLLPQSAVVGLAEELERAEAGLAADSTPVPAAACSACAASRGDGGGGAHGRADAASPHRSDLSAYFHPLLWRHMPAEVAEKTHLPHDSTHPVRQWMARQAASGVNGPGATIESVMKPRVPRHLVIPSFAAAYHALAIAYREAPWEADARDGSLFDDAAAAAAAATSDVPEPAGTTQKARTAASKQHVQPLSVRHIPRDHDSAAHARHQPLDAVWLVGMHSVHTALQHRHDAHTRDHSGHHHDAAGHLSFEDEQEMLDTLGHALARRRARKGRVLAEEALHAADPLAPAEAVREQVNDRSAAMPRRRLENANFPPQLIDRTRRKVPM